MAYIALKTLCLFPEVIDNIILSYIHSKTKAQWQTQFKWNVLFIDELEEDDIDMVLKGRDLKGCQYYMNKRFYSIHQK